LSVFVVPTENKATQTRIILLIKITGFFTYIMAVYDIKYSVSTCKCWKARVGTCVQKRCRRLHPECVSIFGWEIRGDKKKKCFKKVKVHNQNITEC